MCHIENTLSHVEKCCTAHGARLTPKRKQVLSGLLQAEKALSAYEIVEICKRKFNTTIPVMSVYRILEFLQEEHVVHKLDLINKYIACSLLACSQKIDLHEHPLSQFLICTLCLCVKEINLKSDFRIHLQNSVTEAGYRIHNPQLEINCICEPCAQHK